MEIWPNAWIQPPTYILHTLEAIGFSQGLEKILSIFPLKKSGGQSTDHGVVVIDTVAVPGIPATRWVYATRPVFLSMDPAHPCSSFCIVSVVLEVNQGECGEPSA